MLKLLLYASAAFYALLCVFSVVTGVIYMCGKRELNPLELSDKFMEKYADPEKRKAFAVRMGFVTFVVGIVQGITAFAVIRRGSNLHFGIALGFTLFSIASVCFKLKGKIHAFPLLKLAAYLAVLGILLVSRIKGVF